jgi:hypothetical protein
MASANAAIECDESAASLETQLGDEGQGGKRDASIPSWVGRFPGNENNGIDAKTAPMIATATAVTN